MKYGEIIHGKFQSRLNRFIAEVLIEGVLEKVHVKNTGRLKELLLPNADVLLERSSNPNRKTKYSLIAVKKQNLWVNIDSQAPNAVAFSALNDGKISEFGKPTTVKREVSFGNSRFDLFVNNGKEKGFIEVKGVTLEKGGFAMFPDAPTTRGTKHVFELIEAVKAGYAGTVLFIVQMEGCHTFIPNSEMDLSFSNALKEAAQKGVRIIAYDTIVKENQLIIGKRIPVKF